MKGIREAAMGTPEPEVTRYPAHSPYAGGHGSMFDDYDYDQIGYTNNYKPAPYTKYDSSVITISMIIDIDLLGPCADDNSPSYSWELANRKATEIAYDRLEELAGKGYESRYVLGFEIIEGISEYEATITLTPVK